MADFSLYSLINDKPIRTIVPTAHCGCSLQRLSITEVRHPGLDRLLMRFEVARDHLSNLSALQSISSPSRSAEL